MLIFIILVASKNITINIEEITEINIGHIAINIQAIILHINVSGTIQASHEVVNAYIHHHIDLASESKLL